MTDRIESMQLGVDEVRALRQKLAECQNKKLTHQYTLLKRAVAAEAREKVLRDAISGLWLSDDGELGGWPACRDALTLPSDSTALDSAIRQAEEPLRERVRNLEESLGNAVNADWHNEAIRQAKREALLEALKVWESSPNTLLMTLLRRMAEELK